MYADENKSEQKLNSLRSSLWAAFVDEFKCPSGKMFGNELWRQFGIQIGNPIAAQIDIEVKG